MPAVAYKHPHIKDVTVTLTTQEIEEIAGAFVYASNELTAMQLISNMLTRMGVPNTVVSRPASRFHRTNTIYYVDSYFTPVPGI